MTLPRSLRAALLGESGSRGAQERGRDNDGNDVSHDILLIKERPATMTGIPARAGPAGAEGIDRRFDKQGTCRHTPPPHRSGLRRRISLRAQDNGEPRERPDSPGSRAAGP